MRCWADSYVKPLFLPRKLPLQNGALMTSLRAPGLLRSSSISSSSYTRRRRPKPRRTILLSTSSNTRSTALASFLCSYSHSSNNSTINNSLSNRPTAQLFLTMATALLAPVLRPLLCLPRDLSHKCPRSSSTIGRTMRSMKFSLLLHTTRNQARPWRHPSLMPSHTSNRWMGYRQPPSAIINNSSTCSNSRCRWL